MRLGKCRRELGHVQRERVKEVTNLIQKWSVSSHKSPRVSKARLSSHTVFSQLNGLNRKNIKKSKFVSKINFPAGANIRK